MPLASYKTSNIVACEEGAVGPDKIRSGNLKLDEREFIWIDRLKADVESVPDDEGEFINQMIGVVNKSKLIPSEYGL